MKNSIAGMVIAIAVVISTGCAYNISPYGVSPANIETLRTSLQNRQVGTEKFTTSEPTKTSIICRAAGPIAPPNGKTFEGYIQDALTTELKVSGIYNDNSPIRLKAHLTKVDFNSKIGNGNWFIDATVSINGGSFDVTSSTPFDASFVADKACQETAQYFSIAVQNFIAAVVTHPQFAKLATAQ